MPHIIWSGELDGRPVRILRTPWNELYVEHRVRGLHRDRWDSTLDDRVDLRAYEAALLASLGVG